MGLTTLGPTLRPVGHCAQTALVPADAALRTGRTIMASTLVRPADPPPSWRSNDTTSQTLVPGPMPLATGRDTGKSEGMEGYRFSLAGAELLALGSGALWWPSTRMLVVSDLHLGKAERIMRLGGPTLPPYEAQDTLTRLEDDITATNPAMVVCLGDSFDDQAAVEGLPEDIEIWLTRLQAGRRWIWIEGNHDPGPVELGGTHLTELPAPPLTFRHIARKGTSGEVSGHYHPKARLATRAGFVTRRCFLVDTDRLILPAYGTYTGGLRSSDSALSGLMRAEAIAILIGAVPHPIPMPRD